MYFTLNCDIFFESGKNKDDEIVPGKLFDYLNVQNLFHLKSKPT